MTATLEIGPATGTEFVMPRSREEAKEVKRAAKRLRKHQEDQARLLDSWEQYRTLWDGIDFKRQLINMGDKKVRFALVIMGVLNAMLLLTLTRGTVLKAMPGGIRISLAALLIVYGAATWYFVVHAIEALRPKPETRRSDSAHWESRESDGRGLPEARRAVGYFIHGPSLQRTFEEERKLWSRARIAEVNAELILFNRTSSLLLTRQLEQLGKVYAGLKVLAVLAALMMILLVGPTILQGGVPEGDAASAMLMMP